MPARGGHKPERPTTIYKWTRPRCRAVTRSVPPFDKRLGERCSTTLAMAISKKPPPHERPHPPAPCESGRRQIVLVDVAPESAADRLQRSPPASTKRRGRSPRSPTSRTRSAWDPPPHRKTGNRSLAKAVVDLERKTRFRDRRVAVLGTNSRRAPIPCSGPIWLDHDR